LRGQRRDGDDAQVTDLFGEFFALPVHLGWTNAVFVLDQGLPLRNQPRKSMCGQLDGMWMQLKGGTGGFVVPPDPSGHQEEQHDSDDAHPGT
jgi:hypothetical protein